MLVCAGLAYVAILAALGLQTWRLDRERVELERRSGAIAAEALVFQKLIGYGGFIHDFKNYLLRPTETRYLVGARAQIEETLASLDRIEALLGAPDDLASFDRARATLETYRAMVERAATLAPRGISAREIDKVVRVDDEPALLDIGLLEQTVRGALLRTIEQSARLRGYTLASTLLMLVGGLAVVTLLVQRDRRQRAALQRLSEARADEIESFARIAAHDLRTPLQHITMIASMLAEQAKTCERQLPEGFCEELDLIQSRADHLRQMVGDVLGYALAGRSRPKPAAVDLRELLEELGASVLPKTTRFEIEAPLPSLRADALQLETVLRNLLENAVRHAGGDDLTIRVRARSIRDGWLIEVEDNGPGVPAQHRETIFQMFRSFPTAAAPSDPTSSGVGLAMVRRLVRGWGGEVSVRPASPHGAIFTLYLPRP